MKKKTILILFFLIVLGVTAYTLSLYTLSFHKSDYLPARISPQFEKESNVFKIAACPTYHDLSEKLNHNIVKTNSTARSLSLLNGGKVDIILSGRTLRPNEFGHDFEVIGEGYSFLSKKGGEISEKDLKSYTVYTDFNLKEIKENFPVDDVFKVKNVYDFLEEGIVITSWENTDYFRAKLIHLLDERGRRNKLSRQLTLYCSSMCDNEVVPEIKNVYNTIYE